MAKRTMILAVLLLIPGAAPASSVAAVTTGTGPALDFAAWLNNQGQIPKPASGCGPNFCTQQQKTQCAQSCIHHPFVGLECCQDTCTSFCNCGSVPTGC
jgi:hypothetical protein